MKNFKIILVLLCFTLIGLNQVQAQESKSKDGVYFEAEQMPEYPGGFEALKSDIMSSVKYPEDAKTKGIQGKVYVSFIVNKQGKVTNAKVEKGVEPSLDKESLRVINGLKTWKPGKDKGKLVDVGFTIPIQFALDGDKENKS